MLDEIIRALAEAYGIEPNEDGEYDLSEYEWSSGCYHGNGMWLTLANVVEIISEVIG